MKCCCFFCFLDFHIYVCVCLQTINRFGSNELLFRFFSSSFHLSRKIIKAIIIVITMMSTFLSHCWTVCILLFLLLISLFDCCIVYTIWCSYNKCVCVCHIVFFPLKELLFTSICLHLLLYFVYIYIWILRVILFIGE